MADKEVGTFWQKLKSGVGWSLVAIFIWEIIEELLENLIALIITNTMALFVTKALSTLAVITATQGIKVSIKRLLMPIVKTLTYKEGYDKMNSLKKYFTRVYGNKVTGLLAGAGFGGISYFQTLIPFATGCLWLALIVGFVFFNVGIYFGGEDLIEIKNRLADVLLKKEDKKKLKEVEAKAKELAELDKAQLLERARVIVEAEKNAQAENK